MRTLPDYLRRGMRLVIVGCNPGEQSARLGHYYAGRANLFWPLLYDSRIVPEPLEYKDDKRMIEFGIGLTDLVKRPTRGVEEIDRQEFAEGRIILSQKLEEFAPRVVGFNGKNVFEMFAQRPCKAAFHQRSERHRPGKQIALFPPARKAVGEIEELAAMPGIRE